jgi:RNA recognition motif-containing protein
MNIYVGNLSYGVTEEELRSAFVKFGNVSRVNLIIDRETGRSKGFGFVEMPDDSSGEAAIKALNGADLDGRSMKVSEARPREPRSRF